MSGGEQGAATQAQAAKRAGATLAKSRTKLVDEAAECSSGTTKAISMNDGTRGPGYGRIPYEGLPQLVEETIAGTICLRGDHALRA